MGWQVHITQGVYPALMVLFASVSIELPGERKLSVNTNNFDNVNQLRIISFITKVENLNVQIRGIEKVWLKGTYSLVTWFSFQHNSLVLDLSSSLAFATFNTREIRLQMALVKSANKIFRSFLDQRARICILVTQQ